MVLHQYKETQARNSWAEHRKQPTALSRIGFPGFQIVANKIAPESVLKCSHPSLGVVAPACDPSTQEAEAGG